MKPEYLVISGWGPYKDEVAIDFSKFGNQGLFLITGSTGAGKTTIFDAICYALFGEVSGSMRTKDSVRSDFAAADTKTFVRLIMTHGNKQYQIERNPQYERLKKKKTGGNAFTKESENAVLHLPDGKTIQGNRDVNRKMQEILSMDYAQFKQLSMIAQGEFARLLTANSKEKTQIFRNIFNTHQYEQFALILSQKTKEVSNEIKTYQDKMDETIDSVRSILEKNAGEEEQDFCVRMKQQYDKMLSFMSEVLEKKKTEYSKVSEELATAESRLTAYEKELQKAIRNNEILDELFRAHREKEILAEQESWIKEQEQTVRLIRNAEKIMSEYVKKQEADRQLSNVEKKLCSLQEKLKELCEKEIEKKDIAEKKDEMKKLLSDLQEYVLMYEQYQVKAQNIRQKEQRLEQQQQEYLQLEQQVKECKNLYEMMQEMVRHAMVGIVAEQLKKGEPCPVCGSTEHPCIAKKEAGVPDEKELEKRKELYEKQNEKLLTLHGKTASLHGEVSAEKEDIARREISLNEKIAEIANVSEKVIDILYHMGMQSFTDKEVFLQILKKGELSKSMCAQMENTFQAQCDRMQQIQAEKEAKTEMCNSLMVEKENCVTHAKKMDQIFQIARKEADFATEEQFCAYCEKINQIEQLQRQIDEYAKKKAANADYVERMEKAAEGKIRIDLQNMDIQKKEMERKKKDIFSLYSEIHMESVSLQNAIQSLENKYKDYCKKQKEYGIVEALNRLTQGNNGKRLVFEQYVLISYFEEVLRAANIRLQKMSAGRYLLSRADEVSDGRSKDNFELQVLDNYTGKYRYAKTLSGGESFKASLALALGMSDVIQASSGGIRVETLFIDEGFGSLDSESLDMACDTLLSLVDKDRLIGIISHVSELKERITKQVVVTKTHSGSNVSVHI